MVFLVFLELSLNLSRNRKIESKIRMESTFIPSIKYSIKVYQFAMKRESCKSNSEIKWGKKRWKEGLKGDLFYHYIVTMALVSERPINLENVRGLYNYRGGECEIILFIYLN